MTNNTLGRASKWTWFAVMWGVLAAWGSPVAEFDEDDFASALIKAQLHLAKRKHKTEAAASLLEKRMAELPPGAPPTARGSMDRLLLANVSEKEIFDPLMAMAIDRDHPATVVWLLDNPHACAIGDALIAAAALNSHKVVEALLGLSADANFAAPYPPALLASARYIDPPILDDTFEIIGSAEFDGYTALHAAALRESTASAALLLEHGADASARAEGGWTPLHLSLLQGSWIWEETGRPGLAVANLLLAAGADPTAATALVGWTPLHLAALWAPTVRGAMEDDHGIQPAEAPLAGDARCCGDEGAAALEFVRALLAKGADARARTRLGVWTPLRTAMNRVETKLDWQDPVLALLRSAGGEDGGYDDALVRWSPAVKAPALNPVYYSSISWSFDEPVSESTFVPPLIPPGFAFAFALPSLDDLGGRVVAGSFTIPDARERLLFESVEAKPAGDEYAISYNYELISLEDRHGVVRPITAVCSFCDKSYTAFKGVCRDPRTNTDVVVFDVGANTSTGGWDGENWFRYDADKGAFIKIVPDECDWNRSAGGGIGSLAVESVKSRVQFGLVEAALAGDEGSVVRMLAAGADVNERDARGVTALHLAAWIERPAILALLLDAGADVHAVAVGTLETPLHMAGKARDSRIARALLDAGADVDAKQATDATPLHTAAHFNRAETAQVLIAAGGSVKAEDHRGAAPLHVAASEGAGEVAEVLIVAGADLEAVDGAGHTPLHWAVQNGNGAVAVALLDAGADVNAMSVAGTPPFLVAVSNGMEHIALMLMEHGADVHATDDQGNTAADLAESNGMTEVLVRLIEGRWRELSARSSAADVAMDPQGPLLLETVSEAVFDRLLARAIGRDDFEAVLWLLTSPREHAANNALVTAAAIDSHKVVEALLDLPVDVNASTRHPPKLPAPATETLDDFMMPALLRFGGYTALHAAAEHESTASAALLLKHGANASARAEGGWTPLHLALLLGVSRPDLEVANLLLAGGADPTAATALFGWTPLHLAAFRAYRPIDAAVERPAAEKLVSALLSQGADAQASTRLGGWTPLRNEQSRGGAGDDDRPLAPITIYSGDFFSEDGPNERGTEYEVEVYGRETINPVNSASSTDGRRRIANGWPTYSAFGGREVRGSFTSPDSEELLLIEELVLESNDSELSGSYGVVALKDRHGVIRPAIAYDANAQFVGTCSDPQSNTDVVMLVIEGWLGGLNLEDWVYLQYDEAEGALVEVERDSHDYYDGERRDSNSPQELCHWFISARGTRR